MIPQRKYQRERHGVHRLSSRNVIADPSIYRQAIQELDSVFWDEVGKVWVCSGYRESAIVLRDHKRFRSARIPDQHTLAGRGLSDVGRVARLVSQQMLFLDPPDHTIIRAALKPAFIPAAVAAREARVQEIVDGLLNTLPKHGSVDLVETFAGPLPTALIASRLGLDDRTADVFSWAGAYETLLGSLATLPHVRDRAVIPALLDACKVLREEARRRRGGSGADLITMLANSLAGSDLGGDALESALDAVAANCIVLVGGGYQTLTHLVANGIALLSRHADQVDMIREDPTLIGAAIDEIMRLDGSSQYVARQATMEVELGGQKIKADESIVVLLGAANHDPRQFTDSDRFDIYRAQGKHLGFALGRHHCVGSADAEQAARLAILGFLERYTSFQLTDDPIEWGPHGNTRSPVRVTMQVSRASARAGQVDSDQQHARRRKLALTSADVDLLRAANDRPVVLDGERLWMEVVAEYGRRTPHAIALQHGDVEISYGQWDRAGDALADQLRASGVEPTSVVGIFMDRSVAAFVSALGIGRAGGAFLCADSACPRERLRVMFAEARITVLCTEKRLAAAARALVPASVPIVVVDPQELADARRPAPIVSGVRPGDTAYVVFTSGSTGTPKAISVDHEALINLRVAQRQTFRVSSEDRILQWFSMNFDGWPFDLMLGLTAGARLILAPNATTCVGPILHRILREEAITVAAMTPTAWQTLPEQALPALRIAAAAGEVVTEALTARLSAPQRRVLNLYGPAEGAIWSTWHECRPGDGDPPIGAPIVNKRAYIIDDGGRPAAVGSMGELWIGGVGIGRYLGRADLMQERFHPDPLATRPGQLMYATGDLCRWRADGRIEYVGRVDRQVKVRGQRVELEEIERTLAGIPGVRHAAVELRGGRLVATVVSDQRDWDEVAARDHLRRRLHSGMVPSVFNRVDRPQQSSTGKLRLGALDTEPTASAAPGRPPVSDESGTTSTPTIPAAPAGSGLATPPVSTSAEPDRRSTAMSAQGTARQVWELSRLFASCLRLPQTRVRAKSDFFSLGGDSLSLMELLTAVDDQLGVVLEVDAVVADPTPAGIADLIAQNAFDHPRLVSR
ncbi:amino acid adenylation domain-containing protein [Nocardia abscessus]|uniref:amino acid adenylation domain-containing protein n=1 Tax=Nocardia abscessus TaxID=120957 RepID=UPI002454D5B6|nr:amino acid adenylation domain-containing protein [Nocardia abscessus]